MVCNRRQSSAGTQWQPLNMQLTLSPARAAHSSNHKRATHKPTYPRTTVHTHNEECTGCQLLGKTLLHLILHPSLACCRCLTLSSSSLRAPTTPLSTMMCTGLWWSAGTTALLARGCTACSSEGGAGVGVGGRVVGLGVEYGASGGSAELKVCTGLTVAQPDRGCTAFSGDGGSQGWGMGDRAGQDSRWGLWTVACSTCSVHVCMCA